MDNDMDDLKDAIPFTPEELEKIENGADVDIWLELKDITDDLTDEEKKAIEEEFLDLKIPLYMDLGIFKQIGEDSAEEVDELNDKVDIKITVPDEYINTDESVERTYQVIGINQGEPKLLDSDFDEDTKTLTIETDVVVLIAFAYFDGPADSVPTGDGSNTWNWVALMSVSGIGIVVATVSNSKKRRQRAY